MTEQIIDGQPLDFHALRAVVFDAVRDSLEREGWAFVFPRDDPWPMPVHVIEFEGYRVRISVDLCEEKEGISPKDPALLAAKEELRARRQAERPAA